MKPRRILFYSHDTVGLGHLRRTLKLANALIADGQTTCLVVTGSACTCLLKSTEALDFVKLPAVVKTGPEAYRPRTLEIAPGELVALRSGLIRTTVESFAPDVLVVDNVPRGMLGELEDTLSWIASDRGRPRVVLSMRDVLDAGETIRELWDEHGVYELLERVYDEILVFGLRSVYDVCSEYRFPPAVRSKTTFCGYIGTGSPPAAYRAPVKLLFTVGGGTDGAPLAWRFLRTCKGVAEELRAPTLMVLGPDMPATERRKLRMAAGEQASLEVADYLPNFESQLAASSAVVCMGGYNTLCEAVSLGRRTLVIPRHYPRMEQALRARLFKARGLVDMLLPDNATPDPLRERICRLLFSPAPQPSAASLSFEGLSVAVERIRALAAPPSRRSLNYA